ncbi:MAG: right-handed parallel beta-helix repeat-containing protein, partial [Flavobacteriales bacterium]|nr:right-handed parallel beta-helix repeat-containing protein [Flavobacteriales bacterium]
MSEVPGAGPAATVTFNGNNQAITYASSNSNERAVIKLNGADYINFNDLVVNAAGRTASQYGFGFQLMNDANNNMINGCTINIDPSETSTNYAGIVISGSATSATGTGTVLCDDNIITNNNITGGYYGITLVGSSTEANRNNFIVGNNITDTYFYGIYVLGSFNTLIEGNNIERPSRTAVSTFYGIYFTGLSVSAEISKNRISNP